MALLLISLLLKIVMTASIVVAASVVVERSGPFIGSLIAALPTAGGAAMIILAIEHPPAFIAQSAVGSIVANAVVAVFALSYAALAQRRSLAVSLGFAYLVWFVCAAPDAAGGLDRHQRGLAERRRVPARRSWPARRFRAEGAAKRVSRSPAPIWPGVRAW